MLEQPFMWLLCSSNKDCYRRIFLSSLTNLKDYWWNHGWELDGHGYLHENTFLCLLPSLGKLLLSTVLLLNHIVLHVLLHYLTCFHKDPWISLFLNAKLTNSRAWQTATHTGLRYLVKLKLQLTQTECSVLQELRSVFRNKTRSMDTGSRNITTIFVCFLYFLSFVLKNRIWKTENPYNTSMKLFEDGVNQK